MSGGIAVCISGDEARLFEGIRHCEDWKLGQKAASGLVFLCLIASIQGQRQDNSAREGSHDHLQYRDREDGETGVTLGSKPGGGVNVPG
jgi:hypothetical protein